MKNLEKRIEERIARKKSNVLLREDFEDLGGYDQVGRGLRQLVRKGKIVKIGYGLYAKATVSPLSGKPVPRKNIQDLAKEALSRLGVEVQPSSYERDYNQRKTTQVPTGRVIGVRGRVSRKIGYAGKKVILERVPGN